MSMKVEVRPMDMAAPFCSFTAARYAKYIHWMASCVFLAGPEMS